MSGMWNGLCALNKLKDVDKAFFIVCAAIIVLIVAVYFLIPVFNRKLYHEQRENLHKREAAFKSNLQSARSVEADAEEGSAEAAGEEADAAEKKTTEEVDTNGERETDENQEAPKDE